MSWRFPLFLIFVVSACSSSNSTPTNSGGSGAVDPGYVVDANPQTMPTSFSPITGANPNTWTWVPVADAVCANGNATGFAVNLVPNSNDLLIIYEGGGACFSALTCYALQTASYVTTGYDQNTFATEQSALEATFFVTNRQDPNNPFAAMNMAYIPYCTGDIHDGNQVVTYDGESHETHHVGFRNGQIFTRLLGATLPNVNHVWLSGFSAGGFGTVFHYPDTQSVFMGARVDLIDDSGSSFPGLGAYASWGEALPTCASCNGNDFPSFVEAFSASSPNSRFAFLSYTQDTVLPRFFNISETQFTQDLNTYATTLNALPNAKYFFYSGSGHVLLDNEALTIGGEGIAPWLQQMVAGDPNWTSYQ